MARPLTWIDRLRIERVVWTLDQRLYDIPRKARIANRREVRQNLLTAARTSVPAPPCATSATAPSWPRPTSQQSSATGRGTPGRRGRMGRDVDARHDRVLTDAANGFAAGIVAGTPHATGTFQWGGLSALQDTVTCTAVNGHTSVSGGGLSLLGWALWLAIAVMVGRLWRAPATWRARRAALA